MTHGSLFSGIGGFDLAAEWVGWTNVFHCELDPFCQTILKHHFPNEKSYPNIKETDFSEWNGRIDVLSGGFPCQPFSTAGKRMGTTDNRYLWPEMLRAIREIRPRWVVGENVLGIVNWNAGMVFQQVCADLEAEGYAVQPYILPAAGINAPHQRYRTWFVAHSHGCTTQRTAGKNEGSDDNEELSEWDEVQFPDKSDFVRGSVGISRLVRYAYGRKQSPVGIMAGRQNSKSGRIRRTFYKRDAAYPSCGACQNKQFEQGSDGKTDCRQTPKMSKYGDFSKDWTDFPSQSPVCGGDDGLSVRLDGVSFSKWNRESLKAYGNAIVPQLAFRIFKVINQLEEKSSL